VTAPVAINTGHTAFGDPAVQEGVDRPHDLLSQVAVFLFETLRPHPFEFLKPAFDDAVAMTISGHKTRSVFDRYNIVSPDDLREASTKMEVYLQAQNHGHNLGTIEEFRSDTEANGVVRDFTLRSSPTT